MLDYVADYKYIESNGTKLFTAILLPYSAGKFPVVVSRSPYVDAFESMDEKDILIDYLDQFKKWLQNGYAVVFQHCRGRGKSDGDCIPYVNERNDSLNLLSWIRNQDFYNGQIFLKGHSYLTSVWYVTAPFADDIKGAIFNVQDSERYNICYRNGSLKKGLHADWYVGMYKAKSHMKKNYTKNSFNLLPLTNFTKTVFGECSADFDEMLKSPNKTDAFWSSPNGGADARGATDNVDFPILFATGFYDIYTGGIFDMWNSMSDTSKQRNVLVVSPYDHSDGSKRESCIVFPKGKRTEQFGEDYEIEWFNFILDKNKKAPFELGKVTYYRLFENKWQTDSFETPKNTMEIKLGNNEVSYVYNPYDPPCFKGGLSTAFGGAAFQDAPNSRHDIISVYTEPFSDDVFVKGKMSAILNVKSDCEDTCFYVRLSIEKEKGDYGLRDDITSLCYQLGDYKPNTYVDLQFSFDEHAFLVRKGERLRIDIASANNEHYVRHTNNKGLYSEQTTAKVAHNTVCLQKSTLKLPIEL